MHLFSTHAYIGINPIHDSETNLSLVCGAEEIKTAGGARALLNHYLSLSADLNQRFHPLQEAVEISTIAPLRHTVSSTSGSNWCLLGDAGGVLDPLTGEGIFQALSSADFLSKVIQREAQQKHPRWNRALRSYSHNRRKTFRNKTRINLAFQWLIRHPVCVEKLAHYLTRNPRKPDAFIGLIGNVYGPIEGLFKIITA